MSEKCLMSDVMTSDFFYAIIYYYLLTCILCFNLATFQLFNVSINQLSPSAEGIVRFFSNVSP